MPAMQRRASSRCQAAISIVCIRVLVSAVVLLLGACATVGIDTAERERPAADRFDRALLAYAGGRLGEAQDLLLQTIEANPMDLRATDLMRAILKEEGVVDTLERPSHEAEKSLPEMTPAQLLSMIEGRNPALRAAVFEVIEARAHLREANVSIGPELALTTRFYPLGILARMTQSIYGGWTERKARMHAAEAAILSALAAYGMARDESVASALAAYLEGREAMLVLESLRDERARLAQRQAQVDVLVERGHVLPAVRLRAHEQSAGIDHAELESRQSLAAATARLNAMLDRRLDHPIDFQHYGISFDAPATVDAAIETALRKRYDIDDADSATEAARARRAQRSSALPKIDLYTSYGASEQATEGAFLKGFSVGAISRVPLLIRPLRAAQMDGDTALIRQLELRERQVRNDIGAEVVNAFHGWRALRAEYARQRLAVAAAAEEQRVANAREVMEVADDPLAASTADLALLRAQRERSLSELRVQGGLIELGRAMGASAADYDFAEGGNRASTAASTLGQRAVWVWRSEFIDNEAATAEFFERAARAQLSTLFFFASKDQLSTQRSQLASFIERATAHGMTVQALAGEPHWVHAERRRGALDFARAVAAFNAGADPAARFSAVHLDVEPHALPLWSQTQQREHLMFGLVELLDDVRGALGDLPLVIDIPIWFSRRTIDGVPLLRALAPRVDGLVFMAYERDAARIEREIEAALAQFDGSPPRYWTGLSADRARSCAPAQAQTLEHAMVQIEHDRRDDSLFAGVAVHDFDSYLALLTGPDAQAAGRACNGATVPVQAARVSGLRSRRRS